MPISRDASIVRPCSSTPRRLLSLMDSLAYLGALDDDDDDDDDAEAEAEGEAGASTTAASATAAAAPPRVDFAALERAGYTGRSDLTETAEFKQKEAEHARAREEKAAAAAAEERERAAAAETEERARTAAMDQKAIDERVGYEKRYDRTKEDFRKKEERKRKNGQQNRDGNWVEEEKRKLRHGATNFDS